MIGSAPDRFDHRRTGHGRAEAVSPELRAGAHEVDACCGLREQQRCWGRCLTADSADDVAPWAFTGDAGFGEDRGDPVRLPGSLAEARGEHAAILLQVVVGLDSCDLE